jgi:sugar lactone lactonase YvrE
MSSCAEWTAECVLDAKAVLAEGPCWLEDRQALLWVDIEGSRICLFDPTSGEHRQWQTPSHVGVAVPTRKHDWLAATQQGFARLDPENGQWTPLVDPESHLPGNRFNDGKCDPQGRFWAGSIAYDRTPGAASLYRLDANLAVRKMLPDVSTSNGLTWSLDGTTFYYIDTPTRRVDAFDFDGATGEISGRRTILNVPEEMGKPDGMTIDRDGMLWIALWGGHCVSRWNPQNGELLGRVHVAAERVSSCCFGGPDYRQLYITTARTGLSDEALRDQPLAGGIFRVETGHQGLPCTPFAG